MLCKLLKPLMTQAKSLGPFSHFCFNLPKGIRTNCFLVADESVIKSEAAQAPYMPRYTNDLEGEVRILDEDPVVYIRAVDPDYGAPASPAGKSTEDETVEIPSARVTPASNRSSSAAPGDADTLAKEQRKEMAHFKGEATVALPRVFDWLHCVCFFAERGATPILDVRSGWHAVHMQTQKPEAWIRNWSPDSGGVSYAHINFSPKPDGMGDHRPPVGPLPPLPPSSFGPLPPPPPPGPLPPI